jgi:CHASE3 domain sensor protein
LKKKRPSASKWINKKSNQTPEDGARQYANWLEEEEAKRTQAEEAEQNTKEAARQSTKQLEEEKAKKRIKADEREVQQKA